MYKNLIEQIAAYFTSDKYSREFSVAREEYFRRTGKVFEDETMYENRLTGFLEWYLFDRPLVDMHVPPIRLYFLIYREKATQEDIDFLEALQSTTHALFEAVGRTPEILRIKNLFTGTVHSVESSKILSAIEKGDIIDTRLIPLKTCPIFSESLWIHPQEVRKFILSEIEKVEPGKKDSQEALMFDLASMKLKQDRYKHLTAEQIYSWTTFKKENADGENLKSAGAG